MTVTHTGEGVDAISAILLPARVKLPAHSVRLARPGLAVREASGHATLENALHQRLGGVVVDLREGY